MNQRVSDEPTTGGAAEADEPERLTKETRRSDAPKKTVLLVEDDPDIQQTLTDLLEQSGYLTESASNGRQALRLLREGARPALILLDLMMPIMNGWELRAELLNDPNLATIPVIVISASLGSSAVLSQTAAFVRKPVDVDALLATVERCVR
jgi:CheY-like chemotaxis protein